MEVNYPVIIDGALAGKLNVSRSGVMTIFEAECNMQSGIVRLSAYGAGREGYLGVLMPDEDGKMRLRKSVSPAAMRAFPTEIDYAGRAGESLEQNGGESDNEAKLPAKTEENDHEIEPAREEIKAEEKPRETGDGDVYWYSSPDGALVSFDGERTLLALPLGDKRIPKIAPIERKIINETVYSVFETKDGRIIGK